MPTKKGLGNKIARDHFVGLIEAEAKKRTTRKNLVQRKIESRYALQLKAREALRSFFGG